MTTDVQRLVAATVASALARTGRSTRWLAARSGIDHETLERKLVLRADFTVADLSDIAAALGMPVTELAPRVRGDESGREQGGEE